MLLPIAIEDSPYFKLNQYKNAIDDYSKAIDLNPDYIKAYYNRANAYLKLGQYQNAIEGFKEGHQFETG